MREVKTIAQFNALATQRFLAPAVIQQRKAAFALTALAGATVVNRVALGYVPKVIAKVDGALAPITQTALARVKTRIDFIFEVEQTDDVLAYIAAELPRRSPRVSGDYVRGHILLADGVQIPMQAPFPKAREFTFVNTTPYSRKIEIGTTEGGRPFVVQVEPRIYERVGKDARRRFPNVDVENLFMSLSQSAVGAWAASPAGRAHARRARRGNPKTHHHWLTRQPAIIIRGR